MGLKRRSGSFTGTLRAAILGLLPPGEHLSKKQLLGQLRVIPTLKVSVRRLSQVLSKLISDGRVVLEGTRANARFHRK